MILKPVTQEQFDVYLKQAVKGYEKELIKSGIKEEQATVEAENSFKRVLPKGLETPGNHIYHAYEDDVIIGFIWYGLRSLESAFIYDFYIEESMRGKGYGKKVMLACEEDAKKNGINEMKLHVFGHNKPAIGLYEKLGYSPTNIHMQKAL